jgi:hypothetical protein
VGRENQQPVCVHAALQLTGASVMISMHFWNGVMGLTGRGIVFFIFLIMGTVMVRLWWQLD